MTNPAPEHVLIKRYAGHRFYDTVALRYLSLDDLSRLVLDRVRFVVQDAETGADVTRATLDLLH